MRPLLQKFLDEGEHLLPNDITKVLESIVRTTAAAKYSLWIIGCPPSHSVRGRHGRLQRLLSSGPSPRRFAHPGALDVGSLQMVVKVEHYYTTTFILLRQQ